MSVYQSILLATDEADSHEQMCEVYDTAVEWAETEAADLKVLHTVSPINVPEADFDDPALSDIEGEMVTEALLEIKRLAKEVGIDKVESSIVIGNLDHQMLNAKEVDLVVINNDNADYWGTKAETILQSNCDILAVKS